MLSKYIAAGILTALVLAVFLTGQLQAPTAAEAQDQDYGNIICQSPPAESCPTYDEEVPAERTFLSTTMTVGRPGGYDTDEIN